MNFAFQIRCLSLENLAILICGNPRNSGTGANFAAFAKFVACTRITPRTDPRNSATGANFAALAKFVACTRITLPALVRSKKLGEGKGFCRVPCPLSESQ
jgi:hypothetical protein